MPQFNMIAAARRVLDDQLFHAWIWTPDVENKGDYNEAVRADEFPGAVLLEPGCFTFPDCLEQPVDIELPVGTIVISVAGGFWRVNSTRLIRIRELSACRPYHANSHFRVGKKNAGLWGEDACNEWARRLCPGVAGYLGHADVLDHERLPYMYFKPALATALAA